MKRPNEHAAVPSSLQRGRGRGPATPLGGVLALQRGAGNRAVGGILARDTKTKDARVVTLPGIGAIPVESMHMAPNRPATVGEGKPRTPQEMTFTSKQSKHSTALFRESLSGAGKDVEVSWAGGPSGTLRIRLKNALVTSYSTSGDGDQPMETWTLNAESIEFDSGEAKKDAPQDGALRHPTPG